MTDVIGSCTLVEFTSDPENWTENIHVRVLGDFLFHDRHTTLPVAHMGKLPHHTVKMLPDGLHILLLAASVVMG